MSGPLSAMKILIGPSVVYNIISKKLGHGMVSITAYRLIFWLLLAVVALLSMMSLDSPRQLFVWQDKLHHLLAYGVLFWCLLGGYAQQYRVWVLAMSLAVFSGLVEVAQSYTGYRQADLMDLVANCIGILLVGLFYLLWRRL